MKVKEKNKASTLTLRKPIFAQSKSALALSATALLINSAVSAQNDTPTELSPIMVEERDQRTNPYAEPGAPYKAKTSGDERHVKDLAETPQNITVLTQTEIQDSGETDLKNILAAQPGITLGTGENGNAFGDRYIIRGHEARSDVFVDGLRDPGMTTRESFATEQIEITKGPSSTFAGRGSTGGAINSITKKASTEYDFSKVQLGLGTDSYRRITLDSNKKVNDNVALRANLLYGAKDIPDRAPADQERKGIALSGSLHATDRLNLTADFYYLDAKDKPDMGTFIDTATSKPFKNIPVYLQDSDFLKSEVNTLTLRADYDVNDKVRIQNSMRYGTTDNGYMTTSAHGSTRDATDPDAPGLATMTFESHQGWQEVDYFVDQLNVFYDTELAGSEHQFIVGFEYSDMNVLNGNYSYTNNGTTNCVVNGRGGAQATQCMIDASGSYVNNIGQLLDRDITKGASDSDYSVETLSLSAMDTITFNDRWSLFLGARVDDFDYKNDVVGRGATEASRYAYSDTLFNGHIGAVYNINDKGNIYLTYSTSSNINGGESDTAGCGYGGVCSSVESIKNSKPEDTKNIELGTKWNIMSDKLLLTASAFQITKSNVMESERGFDYDAGAGLLNNGENRVQGVEISATGNITKKLSTQFGAAVMDAKVLKSDIDGRVGKTLSNFADKSLFLQVRHQTTPKLSLGGSLKYSSEMQVGQPDTAADGRYTVPGSAVSNLFANYDFSNKMSLRLNINNVTDKDYYNAGYRNGGMVYIGDKRNAQLTLSYNF